MSTTPGDIAEESKEPETPMALTEDPLPESSPWQRAKSVAESMNLQAVMEDMERRYYELRQERDTLREKVDTLTNEKESWSATQLTVASLQQEKEQLQSLARQEEMKRKGVEEEKTHMQERLDRMQVESDHLREELSRIQNSHSELSSKFASIEVESKLKESQAVPLLHEKQRLQTELDNLQAHAHWLEEELRAKGQDYQRLLQESRDRHMMLQTQVQHTENEKIEATTKNAELTKLQNRLHDQVEKLTVDLKNKTQEMIHLRERTDIEIQQERQLVERQQEQLERWEQRYNDVVRENKSLKAAAARATDATERDVQAIQQEVTEKYEKLLRDQAAEYEARIAKQPATFAALPESKRVDDDDEDGPLGLTEVYERWEQTKAQLREMKSRAEKAELVKQRLLEEIGDKAPMLVRQREEYELAMDQIDEFQRRLQAAIEEKENAQAELDHARRTLQQAESRSADQVAEIKVLAGQVQALLTSRAGGGSSGQEFPTSIAEMQQQNQRLLSDNRTLQKRVANLEQQLQTDELRAKVSVQEEEIKDLQAEREKQQQFVDKIVHQRDLYRSLANLNGTPGSDGQELSIEDLSRQQAEKIKALEARVQVLDDNILALSSEKDRLAREKENFEERLIRSETVRKDLDNTVSTLRQDVYKVTAALQGEKAQAAHYKDKLTFTENSLQRSNNEVNLLTNARSELQRINAELQHSLSKEKDLVTHYNSLKDQAETKLRRAQADVEAAKLAERRLAAENEELRREVARQGSLVDSVRRIEATLSAKSETALESAKEEKERLLQQLSTDRKKYESEIENLNEKIREGESRTLEAEKLKAKADAEMLNAKKALLASEAEKRSLMVKYEDIGSKLRDANKKLGITDDSDQADVSLQSRLDELSGELEKSKEEIATLEKSVDSYKKIAKDAEVSYKELLTATEELKKVNAKALSEKTQELERLRTESSNKQEVIVQLTNDLTDQKSEADKAENQLKSEILMLQAKVETIEKDAESAKASATAAAFDLETLQGELSRTQDNYERELKLHSQARSALRTARENLEEAMRSKKILEDKVESLEQALAHEKEMVSQKGDEMTNTIKVLESRLETSNDQNKVLHGQLESLNEMVEKFRSERIASASDVSGSNSNDDVEALRKQITELREVVKYLRSDNEMVQTQLDTAKRAVDREKAAGSILKSNLEEVRAELKILQESLNNSESEISNRLQDTKSKLVETEEQIKLLRDSNKVLREENEQLKMAHAESKEEIAKLKESAVPLEKAQHDATVHIATLESEKESLARELASWKSRVESLVSKFNQVDPEEHRKALQRAEELEKENSTLNNWKTAMEEENTRIREIARRLKQTQADNAGAIESQKKEIERLKEEKNSLSKASTATSELTKERDALKEKVSKLEKDFESTKTELRGANTRNDKLRERLRMFQKTIQELKAAKESGSSRTSPALPQQQPNKSELAQEAPSSKSETDQPKSSSGAETSPKTVDNQGKTPQIPKGGFKFGPSSASESGPDTKETEVSTISTSATSKTSQPLQLRIDAPSFTPASSNRDGASSTVTETAATKKRGLETPEEPSATVSQPETQEKKPPALDRGESASKKELSFKEKLLEKKKQLIEKLKQQKREKEEKEKGSANEEPVSKKARITGDDDAEKLVEQTKTEVKQPEGTPLSGGASQALVPIQEEETEEEKTTEDASSATAPKAVEGAKESSILSTTQPSNPFASTGPPFGTTAFKTPTAFGQSSSFGATAPFGSGGSSTPPVSTIGAFGNAGATATLGSSTAFGGAGSPGGSGFGSSSPAPAPGTFGSAFLNMKPPGNATPPTFTFGSSTKPIVLPTPSITAPAPSPFGAFGSGTFGSTSTFGSSFGSSNTQSFGSRPLFGEPTHEESKTDDQSKRDKGSDAKDDKA